MTAKAGYIRVRCTRVQAKLAAAAVWRCHIDRLTSPPTILGPSKAERQAAIECELALMSALFAARRHERSHMDIAKDVAACARSVLERFHFRPWLVPSVEALAVLRRLEKGAKARRGRPRRSAAARDKRIAGYESGTMTIDAREYARLRKERAREDRFAALRAAGHTLLTAPPEFFTITKRRRR